MNELINNFAEVKIERTLSALSVKFLGFVPHEEFVKVVEHEYQLIRGHHLKKCVIDLRSIPVYDKGTKEYVKEVWFPTAIQLGMRFAAFVVPEAVLGQMSMNKAHKQAQTETAITVEYFKDTDAAVKWLKTC